MEPDHSQRDVMNMYAEIISTCGKFGSLFEIINRLQPSGNKGLSLLDVKCDSMMSYLINLTFLILKKCNGHSIDDEATRERLVNARVILEKIKPLEDKLKYQIEKYVKAAFTGQSETEDKSKYRANLDDLESKSSDEEEAADESKEIKEANKSGIYKPPKLAAVPYTNITKEEKYKQSLENAKRRALNSTVMQELKEEYADTPLEITSTNTLRNTQTNYRKERERYEETYFTRLPVTKKDKHRDKLMNLPTITNLGTEITRFEDLSALEGRLPSDTKKRKKSMKNMKKKKGFKRRKTI